MNRSFLSSARSTFAAGLAGILVLGASAPALASAWDIDPAHSRVGFGVKHMMVSTVHGTFAKYTAAVTLNDTDVTKSTAHIEIDAASISTGNDKRDEHLRSPDFFDVAKFPKIVFDATHIEKVGTDGLSLAGNLTIKNVTKPVVFAVTGFSGEMKDPWGGIRRGATAQAKINRKDFGLTWNKGLETGGVLVGDDVAIELEIELTKQTPKK